MSAALIFQVESLESIGNDLYQANLFGDTGRLLGAIRKLRELLQGLDIDPTVATKFVEKIAAFLGANPELVAIVRRLFGAMTVDKFAAAMATSLAVEATTAVATSGPAAPVDANAETSSFSVLCEPFQSLSREEYHAAGILDNPGAWMALIQSIIALWKMLRGGQ